MSFRKKFEMEFDSQARTLDPDEVSNQSIEISKNAICSRTHDSGWTITGRVREDYYTWVNSFEAVHPAYGRVSGDFEDEVEADSEEGFNHFLEHHPYSEWDYHDI